MLVTEQEIEEAFRFLYMHAKLRASRPEPWPPPLSWPGEQGMVRSVLLSRVAT